MCNIENYKFYKENHICVRCGQEDAQRNRTLCFRCAIKNRERDSKYRKKHKEEINQKKRIANRLRYYRLKDKGMCVSCGKRPARKNKTMCKQCGARMNKHRREQYLLEVYANKNAAEIRV